MDNPNCPMWGKEDVKYLINKTVPPGEEKYGFDDRMLFIDTLALAIALKEDGKLLLGALREKWLPEVESSIQEAEAMASHIL